jgi:hypothetical protein
MYLLEKSPLRVSSRLCDSTHSLEGALSADAQDRIFPYLRQISLPLGKVLYESGGTLRKLPCWILRLIVVCPGAQKVTSLSCTLTA